jgi:hypothetical protein
MDQYEGPLTPLNITFLGGLYLAIIMDRFEGLLTPITIALQGGLYLVI